MRKVMPAILLQKSKARLNISRLKIDENLLWELVKFKSPGKG
jgi:hypothetical protein